MPKKIRLLVTAGPTREMLDPVRFLSNVSTGTMGYATAVRAIRMGFSVTLISGPVSLKVPKGVRFVPVVTAEQMKKAVIRCWPKTDALIMTAAVCDYTPVQYSPSKIKRIKQKSIQFKRTDDILAYVGRRKGARVIMGFALETEDIEKNALRKLKGKNLDYIVANWYRPGHNPFGQNRTSMILLGCSGAKEHLKNVSKSMAAGRLLTEIRRAMISKNS